MLRVGPFFVEFHTHTTSNPIMNSIRQVQALNKRELEHAV